ncbi:MAG: hypothetical protein DHS20C01_31690 [marine bacterium B5-7]|nr:MAG: hypothetical protein DHS20C01_31690 [marine bacterium B5-7]
MTRNNFNKGGLLSVMSRLLLTTLLGTLLAACSITPASREDYQKVYERNCAGSMFDRPTYCDQ